MDNKIKLVKAIEKSGCELQRYDCYGLSDVEFWMKDALKENKLCSVREEVPAEHLEKMLKGCGYPNHDKPKLFNMDVLLDELETSCCSLKRKNGNYWIYDINDKEIEINRCFIESLIYGNFELKKDESRINFLIISLYKKNRELLNLEIINIFALIKIFKKYELLGSDKVYFITKRDYHVSQVEVCVDGSLDRVIFTDRYSNGFEILENMNFFGITQEQSKKIFDCLLEHMREWCRDPKELWLLAMQRKEIYKEYSL